MLRDVLVGTEGGVLHALRVEEKEKRERTWAPLLQLDGTDAHPVRGCHQQVGSRLHTLALAKRLRGRGLTMGPRAQATLMRHSFALLKQARVRSCC